MQVHPRILAWNLNMLGPEEDLDIKYGRFGFPRFSPINIRCPYPEKVPCENWGPLIC